MTRILIKGFYGFGNFGDDILMITTVEIVHGIFPNCELFIDSQSENPDYIHLLVPNVQIVDSTKNLEVDWIIHGGGGVFFDFTNHSVKYYVINQLIKLLGYTRYRNFFARYQLLKGHGLVKQRGRAGLGVGVGTYTSSSNRFLSDIIALSSFDILLVRDHDSIKNAQQYSSLTKIYKSSDLAFLAQHWMPKIIEFKKKEMIAFILRDWSFDRHVSVFLLVAQELIATGHQVKFFAFDENADKTFIQEASRIGQVHVWKPAEMSLQQYLSELAECKLTVSSRAHGAIISACLGIPVCCICIEPKLEQVAQMLPKSSNVIRRPFEKAEVIKLIETAVHDLPVLVENSLLDVARNNREMCEGISIFQNFVASHPPSVADSKTMVTAEAFRHH